MALYVEKVCRQACCRRAPSSVDHAQRLPSAQCRNDVVLPGLKHAYQVVKFAFTWGCSFDFLGFTASVSQGPADTAFAVLANVAVP